MYDNRERFNDYEALTEEKINAAIIEATERVKKYIPYFNGKFPPEASCRNVYGRSENISWTEGFYVGVLWLCYELTGDKCFSEAAEGYLDSFRTRLDEKVNIDHHDLGYLYTLSCVAQYKLTGNEAAKCVALRAAECLKDRFHETGQFIQAWGEMGAEDNYRLIIDCLLNVPLLYWAFEQTGDDEYKRVADAHFDTTLKVIVRDDGSTYHTYFFDKISGQPKFGKTYQGYSDDSAWARGQSWGVYGIILNYVYNKRNDAIPTWFAITDYYLNNLPEDKIAYWDLIFKDGDQPRDTSSNVITICGILEAYNQNICSKEYVMAAKSMMNTIIDKYTTKNIPDSNGLMTHSTYHADDGADECNIWGDYFYLEALTRLKKQWRMYW